MLNLLNKLSPRERNMVVLVLILMGAMVAIVAAKRALTQIEDLNSQIDQREQTLLAYTEQLARSQSVDKAFAHVAAQHSSEWSEAEIHDRLRNEIQRLSMKNPPLPGQPFSPNTEEVLVKIPTLNQGTLNAGGDGYRQYELSLRIPMAEIDSLFTFLERLQASEQSLRIDQLQVLRDTSTSAVAAIIQVTRTIVDGTPKLPEGGNVPEFQSNSMIESAMMLGAKPEDWVADGCTVELTADKATLGADCIKAKAEKANAAMAVFQGIPEETPIEMFADITATGAAVLRVGTGDPVQIPGDGITRQYLIKFTLPKSEEGAEDVATPLITLTDPGTELYVDSVILRKAAQ